MHNRVFISSVLFVVFLTGAVSAQTTEFTYQGKLNTAGTPANGNHDFEFLLFDALVAGNQVGPIVAINSVPVSDGIFSVKLNFGNVFPGANRYLEIRVRPSGQPGMTILTPRQLINSVPYSVKSLEAANAITATTATNSLSLGGVPANQFVQTTDPRLSDARPPTPGSPNYIQNGTSPQASSNFNISGVGAASTFNATTQFNLSGSRILANPGINNLFVGSGAGVSNTSGNNNAFAGNQAGAANTTGNANSFFGSNAGLQNTFGFTNSFFGEGAGRLNVGGAANAFFGNSAGSANTSGDSNTFLGSGSGPANTTGIHNTFVGSGSGLSNISGSNNTLVGWSTSVSSGALSFATAIGVNATAMTSNSITLGRSGGEDQVRIPGNLILITLSTGGFTSLCRNAVSIISTCSSSARYKSNIAPYTSGLDLISRLSPVSFIWKEGGMPDLGLVAEEVKQVEPLLTIDEGGEVEGVKYDRLGVVLINAVKEQQAQIERQSALIEAQAERLSRQQTEIDAFKKYVCSKNSKAEICKSRVRR